MKLLHISVAASDHNELEDNFDWLVYEFEVPVGVKRKLGMNRHQGFRRWGSVSKLFGLDTREGINKKMYRCFC